MKIIKLKKKLGKRINAMVEREAAIKRLIDELTQDKYKVNTVIWKTLHEKMTEAGVADLDSTVLRTRYNVKTHSIEIS